MPGRQGDISPVATEHADSGQGHSAQAAMGGGLGTERLATLSDGIFAIAMTLLVLGLKAPGPSDDLGRALGAQWPTFLSYVLSFLILGVFWVGHRLQFSYIRRSDRLQIWINIVFLMVIAFIPFSAAVLGSHARTRAAIAIYGANMAAGWTLLLINWWYAARRNRLSDLRSDSRLARATLRLLWAGPLLYLLGMVLSLISTTASIVVYALVPALYVLGHPDRHWHGTRANGALSEQPGR